MLLHQLSPLFLVAPPLLAPFILKIKPFTWLYSSSGYCLPLLFPSQSTCFEFLLHKLQFDFCLYYFTNPGVTSQLTAASSSLTSDAASTFSLTGLLPRPVLGRRAFLMLLPSGPSPGWPRSPLLAALYGPEASLSLLLSENPFITLFEQFLPYSHYQPLLIPPSLKLKLYPELQTSTSDYLLSFYLNYVLFLFKPAPLLNLFF